MTAPALSSTILLSPVQLQQYQSEGYVVVRNLIPREELTPVRQTLLEMEAGNTDWPEEHFQYFDPDKLRTVKGTKFPGGVQGPAKQSEDFRRVADHPRLQSAMRQLLGGPVVRFTDQCGIKTRFVGHTEQGGCSFYHQDSYYWRLDPKLGCNAWIPLDEVGKDAIALAVMPRSQEGWQLREHENYYDDPAFYGARSSKPFQRHRIARDQIDFSQEALIPMRAGDGLFFTNYTWHRSEPNRTGRTLMFYAIAYRLEAATQS